MSFPCPHCNNENTQKLSLMNESSSRCRRDATGVVRSSHSGLARRYAPPQPRRYLWRVILCFPIAIVGQFLVLGILHSHPAAALSRWIFYGGSLVWVMANTHRYNRSVTKSADQQSHETFLCSVCGRTFIPSESAIPRVWAVG